MRHLKKFNESPFFGSTWGDDTEDVGPFSHWKEGSEDSEIGPLSASFNFGREGDPSVSKKIEDYPMSVRTIFNRFNPEQRGSISDNLEKFAKTAKKLYYNGKKSWKELFTSGEVKDLVTCNEIIDYIEEWIKR